MGVDAVAPCPVRPGSAQECCDGPVPAARTPCGPRYHANQLGPLGDERRRLGARCVERIELHRADPLGRTRLAPSAAAILRSSVVGGTERKRGREGRWLLTSPARAARISAAPRAVPVISPAAGLHVDLVEHPRTQQPGHLAVQVQRGPPPASARRALAGGGAENGHTRGASRGSRGIPVSAAATSAMHVPQSSSSGRPRGATKLSPR